LEQKEAKPFVVYAVPALLSPDGQAIWAAAGLGDFVTVGEIVARMLSGPEKTEILENLEQNRLLLRQVLGRE